MYSIKVNGKFNHTIEKNNEGLLINNNKITADIKQINKLSYHIINQLNSYTAEVIAFNTTEKTAEIKVNNNIYTITAKDQYDVLLDKLGLSSLNSTKVSEVKAPMPGMVLKVFVEEGATVQKGENLFILEAMKMENIIKSPADVTIKAVNIKPGDKVEKGQVLLKFS